MAEDQIHFDDGAAYERMMGVWSRLAGDVFIHWLAPQPGLRWVDIGCGNGAFTELLVEHCAPAEVQGVDPSDGQLAFARGRPGARLAKFQKGDAMALPFPGRSFDAAVMALVIFFVPEPSKGVAEMARVLAPGGLAAAYAWDMAGDGGFPLDPLRTELHALGIKTLRPPNADASRISALRDLWTGAGFESVETRTIDVARTFADFDELWLSYLGGPGIGPALAGLSASDSEGLKIRLRARLPADPHGRITYSARANAVKGRLPK